MTACSDPLCVYRAQQLDRLMGEVHLLRLQVADGPRARVLELEHTVRLLNERIADMNRKAS